MLSITTPAIRAFITSRLAAKASPGEINRELACLKRMFTLAVQAGKLHGKPHIPMLPEDNVRRASSSPRSSRRCAVTRPKRCGRSSRLPISRAGG
jgi:hypothetical protein